MSELVKIRGPRLADEAFIYATWCNNSYASEIKPPRNKDKKKAWFNELCARIKASLDQDQILIACLGSDPDYILGYAVFKAGQSDPHWLYVRRGYREQGIERLLIRSVRINPIRQERSNERITH